VALQDASQLPGLDLNVVITLKLPPHPQNPKTPEV
jgi:hypothetical protein